MINPRTSTVAVTDFRLKTPSLAKVIVSFTGDVDRAFIHEALMEKFDHQVQPIKASFKLIAKGVAVGFLKANRAIRVVNEKEIKAYRVMGSNILMDDNDKSLWEVKSGAGGSKYLAKHGQEDLSALVASVKLHRTDIPRLNHLTIAKAGREELVAFVDNEGDVDHGFTLGTTDDKVRVMSFNRRMPVTVEYDNVVSIYPISVPPALHASVMASLTSAQKSQANEYWRQLYSYDPDYMRDTIAQVNEGTFA